MFGITKEKAKAGGAIALGFLVMYTFTRSVELRGAYVPLVGKVWRPSTGFIKAGV